MRVQVWLILGAAILFLPKVTRASGRECHPEGDGLVCGYNCKRSTAGHWSCANTPDGQCEFGLDGRVSCTNKPIAGPQPTGSPIPRFAECLKSRDGHVTCGYQCFENLAGHAICAQTPEGTCLMDQGRVLCSEVDSAPWIVTTSRHAECLRDEQGQIACGYHCVLGTDGRVQCAQTPDGACAADDFGHVVCTNFKPESRLVQLPELPQSICMNDNAGHPVCGYQCLKASDGSVRCATTPDGACAIDSLGHVVCTEFPIETRLTRATMKDRLGQGANPSASTSSPLAP